MYRIVVVRPAWPASRWIAFAGAASRRQVRAEGVAKDVEPSGRLEAGSFLRRLEQVAQEEARRRLAVVAEEHVVTA